LPSKGEQETREIPSGADSLSVVSVHDNDGAPKSAVGDPNPDIRKNRLYHHRPDGAGESDRCLYNCSFARSSLFIGYHLERTLFIKKFQNPTIALIE